MLDFVYENKCEIHFGRLPESRIAECIKKFGGKKVLLHYGGGSDTANLAQKKSRNSWNSQNKPHACMGIIF